MIAVQSAAVGTCHPVAVCCWCASPLVVSEVEQLRCWLCPRCFPRQVKYAVRVNYSAKKAKELGLLKAGVYVWHVPLPSQVPLYEASADGGYVLWGGRAGPGKSTGGRWLTYWRSLNVPGHETLLLRENWDQLRDNHTLKMAVEVPLLGGIWKESDRLALFGRGSDQAVVHCGHMADAAALTRYLGIEYGLILPDEASLYPLDAHGTTVLAELSTRARRDYTDRQGGTVKGLFLPTTNPGGPSAEWLKAMHIDHTPDYERFPALRPAFDAAGAQVSGYRAEQWRYIAASLKDNPYMRADYAQTNLAVLSEVRYKQLAEGDWESFEGQFFPSWDSAIHVRTGVLAA